MKFTGWYLVFQTLQCLLDRVIQAPISTSPARHADFHRVDCVSQDYRRKLKAIAIFLHTPQ